MPVVSAGLVVVEGVVVVVVVADGLVVVVSVEPESDVPEPDVLLPELSVGDFSQTGALEPEAPDVLLSESDELDGTVTPEPLLSVVPDDPASELPGVVLSISDAPEDDVPDVLLSEAPPELPAPGSDRGGALVPVVPLEVSDWLLPYPGEAGVGVPVLLVLPVPDDDSVVDPDVSPDVPLVSSLLLDSLPADGVELLPEPVLKSDAPLVEPLLAGVSVVALVPDVPYVPEVSDEPDAPDVPDVPDVLPSDMPDVSDGDASCCSVGGGVVVVMVVVVWPKAAVAVPSRESKMARGNFFMLTPSVELRVALKLPKVFFRPEFIRRFSAPTR